MAKTITIIGLLNKIYNKEELPKIIKYQDTIFTLQDNYVYTASDGVDRLLDHIKYDFSSVRETVEIIEEQQDIDKIKLLEPEEVYFKDGTELVYKLMYDKINEIAMRLNKIDKKIKDKE